MLKIKPHLKWLIPVAVAVLALLLVAVYLLGGFDPKAPLDRATFTATMEKRGFTVSPAQDDLLLAEGETFAIAFKECHSVPAARDYFNTVRLAWDTGNNQVISCESSPTTFHLVADGYYYTARRIGCTVLLSSVPVSQQQAVEQLGAELGY